MVAPSVQAMKWWSTGVYGELVIISSSIVPMMVLTAFSEIGIHSSAPNTRRCAEGVCIRTVSIYCCTIRGVC